MTLLVFAIAVAPLLAAAILGLPRSERFAGALTVAAASVSFALSVALMLDVHLRGPLIAIPHYVEVDAFGALIVLLIALVSTTAAIFSHGYIAHEHPDPRRIRLYYANFNLFVFSMLTIPLTVELGLVWILVELTTLLSVMLVSYTNTREALEAAWKYMVLTLMGATIAVLGVLVLFWALRQSGSTDFTWGGLMAGASAMPPALVKAAFVLLLIGYGAKIGLVPLHTWLPDAHSQAPSPVCALLSGIETTAVLYVLLRLRGVFARVPEIHVGTWFAIFGAVSVVVAVLLIVQTRDYKRLFAFSTVEHMGIILAAASLGTPLGDAAVVWQIVAHSVTKSFCFYAAGSTLLVTGSRSITGVRGLLGRSRTAASALIAGALAISGAPPFAVFLSELAVLRAGIDAHAYALTAVLAAGIVIGFCGVLSHVTDMVSGPTYPEHPPHASLPRTCLLALAIAAVPMLVLGAWMPLSIGSIWIP